MKNVAASVRARLGNQSKAEGQTLDFLIERFAIGRLFWRLSQSPYAKQFVLKGAQLFSIWEENPHRPTRDIDFLGFGDSSPEAVNQIFTDILSARPDPDDGLEWGTVLPQDVPFALTAEFAADATKLVQWKAFLRKNRLNGSSFEELIARLNRFLHPVFTEKNSNLAWKSDSGWTHFSNS
jgi:hypothetical protein